MSLTCQGNKLHFAAPKIEKQNTLSAKTRTSKSLWLMFVVTSARHTYDWLIRHRKVQGVIDVKGFAIVMETCKDFPG